MGRYLSKALAASGRDVLVLGRKPEVQFTDKGIHYQAVDASDMAVLPPCWQRWSMARTVRFTTLAAAWGVATWTSSF